MGALFMATRAIRGTSGQVLDNEVSRLPNGKFCVLKVTNQC
jgi:hypothetical protein